MSFGTLANAGPELCALPSREARIMVIGNDQFTKLVVTDPLSRKDHWRIEQVSCIAEAVTQSMKGSMPDLFICGTILADGRIDDLAKAFRIRKPKVRILALLERNAGFSDEQCEDLKIVATLEKSHSILDELFPTVVDVLTEYGDGLLLGDLKRLELKSDRSLWHRGLATGIRLTITQARLMEYLIARAGQIVPKGEAYINVLRREAYYDDRALDQHVAQLRKLLKAAPINGTAAIKTIRGVGYRFEFSETAGMSLTRH